MKNSLSVLLLPLLVFSFSSCVVMENASERLQPVKRNIRQGLANVGERSRDGIAWIENKVEDRQARRTPRRGFDPGTASSIWSGTSSSSSRSSRSRTSVASTRSGRSSSSSAPKPAPKPKPQPERERAASKPPPSGWTAGTTPAQSGPRSSDAPSSMPAANKNEPASPPSPQEDFRNLPFAIPVPGKSGYVSLPNRSDLPEIDVRGIAPGTPVEIQDPNRSGDTIQFKVP